MICRHGVTEGDLEAIGLATMTELKRVEGMFDHTAKRKRNAVAVGK